MRGRSTFLAGAGLGLIGLAGLTIFLAMPRSLPDFPALDPAKYPGCVLEPVPADHVLVEATANDGGVLTNILFDPASGQRPDSSAVVHVQVAAGSQPITLVAAGRNILWEFSGDVQRVKRVVAMSVEWDRNVAIGGIAKERIEFVDRKQCPLFAYATGTTVVGDVRPQQQSLQLMFGRKANSVAWYWKAHTLSLPDGAWSLTPPGGERFRNLDPKDFISPVALGLLPVKPASAGLEEYGRDGTIRAPRPDEVEKFIEGASARYRSKLSPDYRIAVRFDYVVTRLMTLPVGMFGPRRKLFLFLDGVPPPEGERSHNCVAMMDGFRMEEPTMCLGSVGAVMDQLTRWPDQADLAKCRVWQPLADASLEAVSVAGPKGARDRLNGEVRSLAPVVVRVQKPGNVALVLESYSAVVWRIEPGPATHITGIVTIGHDASTVQGAAPEVPVMDLSRAHAGENVEPGCMGIHDSMAAAYNGGADAMILDRQVEALLGRKLDGLRGGPELTEAVIR